MSAIPKNAWNAMVASSSIRRIGYGGRVGPGSTPISTKKKRYPLMRKWTVISMWPWWVASDHSNHGV